MTDVANELDRLLTDNQAPAPRGSLSDRILAAAETAEPANDDLSRRPWWAMGGIAAMALMAAVFWMQPDPAAETDWNQIADSSGFSALYDWVEGTEG